MLENLYTLLVENHHGQHFLEKLRTHELLTRMVYIYCVYICDTYIYKIQFHSYNTAALMPITHWLDYLGVSEKSVIRARVQTQTLLN